MTSPGAAATAGSPPRAAMPRVLWALLFGNLVIGAGVMVVPGVAAHPCLSDCTSGAAQGAGHPRR